MKLKIEQLSYDDLEFLNETRNLVATEYLHDSRIFGLEETKKWFYNTSDKYFIIKKDDERIGYFRTSNHSTIHRNIYIGADLHPSFWGRGYAYEAYKIFIPHLFFQYDLHKISLEVLTTNERGIRLYKKLGFVEEGVKREEVLKNDEWVDSIIMSILKREYALIKDNL